MSIAIKKRLVEVLVVVLQVDAGDDTLTCTTGVEHVEEIVGQAVRVCREYESLRKLVNDAWADKPRYKVFTQELKQLHADLRKIGLLTKVVTEENESYE